jgi:hypothetical protein
MTAATHFCGGDDEQNQDGTSCSHAYTVISCMELRVNRQTVKLIKVRNPWGREAIMVHGLITHRSGLQSSDKQSMTNLVMLYSLVTKEFSSWTFNLTCQISKFRSSTKTLPTGISTTSLCLTMRLLESTTITAKGALSTQSWSLTMVQIKISTSVHTSGKTEPMDGSTMIVKMQCNHGQGTD